MAGRTAPFSRFEFMIAWRYLRARRAEGGVSVMTWISLVGITLGVAALIITLAVRAGFRAEFVDTILGSNAHVTVYSAPEEVVPGSGIYSSLMRDYDERAARIARVPGVIRAAPIVRAQAMVNFGDRSNVAEVFGITEANLRTIPRIANPETSLGDIDQFGDGIAMGAELARELGVGLGDKVKLISPNGAKTPVGTTPRVNAYTVTYIFTSGRWDIDKTRVYMPFAEAQSFFNREGGADEIEVDVTDPENVDDWSDALTTAGGPGTMLWSWRDASGSFLRALSIEDNVMFVILSVLVLIATMNITSGLIMLVKNKGRDIGILRTMGLTEGSILRVFFLCGAFTGVIGTLAGLAIGVVFSLYINDVMSFVNWINGGGVWDPSIRGIYELPAKLQAKDIVKAVALSLGLSFVVTIFPARRAARLNPVEALRYE
ncbi:lipoprotein-releasing ABC transporter permease subunit [Paenirhodobacter enshiensis]|uniref:ABC transporter substrate-binding protein n=1 Tax=Paenirhodobacter enshiensis TaxID=1105367 RepID=A0A086XR25_9RHOB|nr:lipoprotein-releasing ABC transporter permease subunit [Paenirhodobacter enshiensis]KFI24475.1 ABC transporter substrate-binding protein [Paenirhodobacter enshiensis]